MAVLKPVYIPPQELSEDAIRHIVALGREQAQLMDRLEQALRSGEDQRVIEAARELVRIEQEVKKQ